MLQKADNDLIEMMTEQALTMANGFGTATKSVKSSKDNFREAGQDRKSKSAKQP